MVLRDVVCQPSPLLTDVSPLLALLSKGSQRLTLLGEVSQPLSSLRKAGQPPLVMKVSQPPLLMKASQPPLPRKASQPPLLRKVSQPLSSLMKASQPPLLMKPSQLPLLMKVSQPPLPKKVSQLLSVLLREVHKLPSAYREVSLLLSPLLPVQATLPSLCCHEGRCPRGPACPLGGQTAGGREPGRRQQRALNTPVTVHPPACRLWMTSSCRPRKVHVTSAA